MKKLFTQEQIPEIRINILLTEKEVGRLLNVSVASLRRWRLLREGPPYSKLGSLVRYDPASVQQWLASRPVGGTMSPETRKLA